MHAQPGAKNAVKVGGAAAALDVPQHRHARLQPDVRPVGQLVSKAVARACVPSHFPCFPVPKHGRVSPNRLGALRHDDNGGRPALCIQLLYAPCNDLHVVRDLGNEDELRARRHTTVKSQPARITTHDLHHKNTIMTFGRVLDAVARVHDGAHRCVKAEREVRRREVIVDGFGDADYGDVQLQHQLPCNGHGAISTDHNQGIQPEFAEILTDLCRHIGFLHSPICLLHRKAKRIGLVVTAQNSATAAQDVLDCVGRKFQVAVR
mmetsp:Transcript_19760/g.50181  ORF Transcript_19760/g.50181 Transcript_19760/m.50181 type:complete len:263 (+) Transcript_19760:383-1171(+)